MTFRGKRTAAIGGMFAAVILAAPFTGGSAHAATDDEFRSAQWNLDQIKAEQAWPTSTGEGATVAVVDSGVDLTHPDLADNLVPGVTTVGCPEGQTTCGDGSWVGMDGKAQDPDTHGTHVAGIIAATTNNATGVAGIAPDAKVMPVKSLEDGTGTTEDIAGGIRWATDNGADVINMSLGGLPGSELLTVVGADAAWVDAVKYATDHGVTVIAAAGNSTYPFCSSPAIIEGVLCVTSTDRNQLPSYFSNLGLKLDLQQHTVAAPGGQGLLGCEEDILSTVPVGTGSNAGCGNDSYDAYAGTSMASPAVAGTAALLSAQCRPSENVIEALEETAKVPLVGKGLMTSPWYGQGLINAEAAVAYEGASC